MFDIQTADLYVGCLIPAFVVPPAWSTFCFEMHNFPHKITFFFQRVVFKKKYIMKMWNKRFFYFLCPSFKETTSRMQKLVLNMFCVYFCDLGRSSKLNFWSFVMCLNFRWCFTLNIAVPLLIWNKALFKFVLGIFFIWYSCFSGGGRILIEQH